MYKLGGSLFVHNGLKYDYCVKESLESLLELCDEVVVLDAESDDGTLDFLHKLSKKQPKLRVFNHGTWECAPDFSRLAILANQARELLNTEWHFMIQADEVLHENSFKVIREAIKRVGFDSFNCSRINLYKDFEHYVKFNSKNRPCGDIITRLGRKYIETHGDAESIRSINLNNEYTSQIILFHYGFVRKRDIILDKAIDMQKWFGIGVDARLVKMKECGKFIPEEIIPDSELELLKWTHPKFALNWVEERRKLLNN